MPGVVGVGEGKSQGEQCIVVFVQDGEAKLLEALPDTIEGYSLTIEVSGEFRAQGGQ